MRKRRTAETEVENKDQLGLLLHPGSSYYPQHSATGTWFNMCPFCNPRVLKQEAAA